MHPVGHVLPGRLQLSKGQLVDVDGRLQTRQWDDDAGKCEWPLRPETAGRQPSAALWRGGMCSHVLIELCGHRN